jgi:hypothetical protein
VIAPRLACVVVADIVGRRIACQRSEELARDASHVMQHLTSADAFWARLCISVAVTWKGNSIPMSIE